MTMTTCPHCGHDHVCHIQVRAEDAARAASITNSLLTAHRDVLGAMISQFRVMVEWTNDQGQAKDSATLYKLIQDIEYLLAVAPNVANVVVRDTAKMVTK